MQCLIIIIKRKEYTPDAVVGSNIYVLRKSKVFSRQEMEIYENL